MGQHTCLVSDISSPTLVSGCDKHRRSTWKHQCLAYMAAGQIPVLWPCDHVLTPDWYSLSLAWLLVALFPNDRDYGVSLCSSTLCWWKFFNHLEPCVQFVPHILKEIFKFVWILRTMWMHNEMLGCRLEAVPDSNEESPSSPKISIPFMNQVPLSPSRLVQNPDTDPFLPVRRHLLESVRAWHQCSFSFLKTLINHYHLLADAAGFRGPVPWAAFSAPTPMIYVPSESEMQP